MENATMDLCTVWLNKRKFIIDGTNQLVIGPPTPLVDDSGFRNYDRLVIGFSPSGKTCHIFFDNYGREYLLKSFRVSSTWYHDGDGGAQFIQLRELIDKIRNSKYLQYLCDFQGDEELYVTHRDAYGYQKVKALYFTLGPGKTKLNCLT